MKTEQFRLSPDLVARFVSSAIDNAEVISIVDDRKASGGWLCTATYPDPKYRIHGLKVMPVTNGGSGDRLTLAGLRILRDNINKVLGG